MKYRAWDTKFNSWINPKDVQVNGLGQVFIFQDENLEWYEDRIGQAKILKDTQLKDKNGKEIYEGDIVKDLTAWMGYNPFFEVKYFVNDREKANPLYGDVGYNISSGSIYEIIGNVFENPELIGGRNEIKG